MPSFDEQYRRALQLAAQTYRLDELEKTLRSWRLNAWQVTEGPDAWRALLAKAERVLATGELPAHVCVHRPDPGAAPRTPDAGMTRGVPGPY